MEDVEYGIQVISKEFSEDKIIKEIFEGKVVSKEMATRFVEHHNKYRIILAYQVGIGGLDKQSDFQCDILNKFHSGTNIAGILRVKAATFNDLALQFSTGVGIPVAAGHVTLYAVDRTDSSRLRRTLEYACGTVAVFSGMSLPHHVWFRNAGKLHHIGPRGTISGRPFRILNHMKASFRFRLEPVAIMDGKHFQPLVRLSHIRPLPPVGLRMEKSELEVLVQSLNE